MCWDSLVLRVVDSCRMLPSSLDQLATNLRSRIRPSSCTSCTKEVLCESCKTKEPGEKLFPNVEKHVRDKFGAEHVDKFFGKQIFPHEFVTGVECLIDTKSLPPKCHFTKGLNSKEEISQEKYISGLDFWQVTKCHNLLDFALNYLAFDVLVSESKNYCKK